MRPGPRNRVVFLVRQPQRCSFRLNAVGPRLQVGTLGESVCSQLSDRGKRLGEFKRLWRRRQRCFRQQGNRSVHPGLASGLGWEGFHDSLAAVDGAWVGGRRQRWSGNGGSKGRRKAVCRSRRFAGTRDCSAPLFHVWRQRLNRNARARERARPIAAGRSRAQGHEPRPPALFVPLRVATADQQPAVAGGSGRAGQGVRIKLPGGAVVRLPGEASGGW